MLSIDDAEGLIEDLASRLAPPVREAFCRKALDAVIAQPPQTLGEGTPSRMLAPIWSAYYQPKPNSMTTWHTSGRQRSNKLLLVVDVGDEEARPPLAPTFG